MKPQAVDYIRADTAKEAIDLLAKLGQDARILAGGQSLMAVLNMRLAQPTALIDISRCQELDYARIADGHLCVGAAATQASVEWRPELAREVPLLAQIFPHISHFQIRNRGTVCGSVAHADPSAELPLALVALGGQVVLRGPKKRRVLAADDFFQGMLMTARAPDELVEEVRFPLGKEGERVAFTEFATRHGDFAVASVAALRRGDTLRLAVGGVADRPRAATLPLQAGAEQDTALNDFAWSLGAQDDHHASARFRRHLVRRLGAQMIARVTDADAAEETT